MRFARSSHFTIPHLAALVLSTFLTPAPANADDDTLRLRLREKVPSAGGSFRARERNVAWDPAKTAIIVCDMWNEHWCKGATRRVGEMAPRMNEVLKNARDRGVFIIHAPSDTLDFYKDTAPRLRAQAAPKAPPKVPLQGWCSLNPEHEAGLPIDDSDGGCDCLPQCKGRKAWSRQIETLEIFSNDAITDSAEAYNLLEQRGIDNVIVMGVHTNMCVLGRPFSIRQMVYQEKNVVLMRDMTDTMYNPRMRPFVPHFRGTDRVIDHIETYWCPTTTSASILGGAPFTFSRDVRPHIAFMIGEKEYGTKDTLPKFIAEVLEPQGFRATVIHVSKDDANDFSGIDAALETADALFVSVRRRTPKAAQFDAVKRFIESGKPVLGIRTSSHAFDIKKAPPSGHGDWRDFDRVVLGGHYQNHYGNKLQTTIQARAKAAAHPILKGVPSAAFPVKSSLYRGRNLAATTTVLMHGWVEENGKKSVEPVAWTNLRPVAGGQPQKIFYTSLGGVDDFAIPAFRRMLLNAVLWATERPVPDRAPGVAAGAVKKKSDDRVATAARPPTPKKPAKPSAKKTGPLDPPAALAALRTPDDIALDLVLSEPAITQPLHVSFDARGRMWLVEYIQYPEPAGLKMVSRDQYWRAVWDKVPKPPPHHERGRDRISIHADTDGDGTFDAHKLFVDGLSIATAVAHGRGGIWVMNPPYLLFYPDADRDDRPDGDPIVHLAGFGLEDTHSVANSITWGPDGWLYGAQGSTVTAKITRPGIEDDPPVASLGQLIWRYEPRSRRFEIFAEGGGNAFGVEIDARGHTFSGHNGGDTRGFHYLQGSYSRKGFTKHGPLSNPYAFGYFRAMKHHSVQRFTHTFVMYEGGALPERYNGVLLGVAPLLHNVVESDVTRDGSSFKTKDRGHLIASDDRWFQPVDIEIGPSGALWIADWYDDELSHLSNAAGRIDKERGRVYRVRAKSTPPQSASPSIPDLELYSSGELVALIAHPNRWYRRTALRILADRRDARVIPVTRDLLKASIGQIALEALWMTHVSGGFDDDTALIALAHDDAQVRRWAVRLVGDRVDVPETLTRALIHLALTEPDADVRSQLAATSRRLGVRPGLQIAGNLFAHDDDADDIHIPLMLWWTIEKRVDDHREDVIAMLESSPVWSRPLVERHILPRLMRRLAVTGKRRDLVDAARLLRMSPSKNGAAALLAGFEEAAKTRPLPPLPDELRRAIAKRGGASLALRLRTGDAAAASEAITKIRDAKTNEKARVELVEILVELEVPSAAPALANVASDSKAGARLRAAAFRALAPYPEVDVGTLVAAAWEKAPAEVRSAAEALAVSREPWALALLESIDAGHVEAKSVSRVAVERVFKFDGERLVALAEKHFGSNEPASPKELAREITRVSARATAAVGDRYRGKKLFARTCGNCHRLFEEGGDIGPDLTSYQRSDLGALVRNIVNPNYEIREGFESLLVVTEDGRAVTGFVADEDPRVLVVRGATGERVTVEKKNLLVREAIAGSVMPEGLLSGFDDENLRDLFAYLQSTQPLNN